MLRRGFLQEAQALPEEAATTIILRMRPPRLRRPWLWRPRPATWLRGVLAGDLDIPAIRDFQRDLPRPQSAHSLRLHARLDQSRHDALGAADVSDQACLAAAFVALVAPGRPIRGGRPGCVRLARLRLLERRLYPR